MKNIIFSICAFCILFALASCIPSIRPVSEKNETTDPKLVGTWFAYDTKYEVKLDGDVYRIHQTNKDGEVDYRMILSKVGDDVFASIGSGPDNQSLGKKYGGFVIPIYRLYRIEITDDEVKLLWANGDKDKRIPAKGIKVSKEDEDAEFIITENDEQKLKDWLKTNRDYFKGELVYKRDTKKDTSASSK